MYAPTTVKTHFKLREKQICTFMISKILLLNPSDDIFKILKKRQKIKYFKIRLMDGKFLHNINHFNTNLQTDDSEHPYN